jgi:hypothetical protein
VPYVIEINGVVDVIEHPEHRQQLVTQLAHCSGWPTILT